MTNLGLMHLCLGIEVYQQQDSIFIAQQRYAREILKAFGMEDCKSVVTPMDVNGKLSLGETSTLVDEKKYRKLVGSLIFLCNTRPDLCYVVGVLSRFSNIPRQNHWQAGTRLLKFLKGTLEYSITYGKANTRTRFCD